MASSSVAQWCEGVLQSVAYTEVILLRRDNLMKVPWQCNRLPVWVFKLVWRGAGGKDCHECVKACSCLGAQRRRGRSFQG